MAKNQAKGKINVCKIARLPVLEIINITTGYFLNQYAHGLPLFVNIISMAVIDPISVKNKASLNVRLNARGAP